MERIYLDNAATTRLFPEVLEKMLPYFGPICGNPSSVHAEGREARGAVEEARRQLALALGTVPGELYFTSGGTESINLALKGAALAYRERGRHLITSSIEHPAVLRACDWLESRGFTVTRLPVGRDGILSPDDIRHAITPRTTLLSVMAANNEIGTIQPIREIGALTRRHGVLFHCDAVQAAGAMPLCVEDLSLDLLSVSSHKFHGPKGVGALYVRKGILLAPLIHGGYQEGGIRPGTEDVAGIVGMGEAIRLATGRLEASAHTTAALRDRLVEGITSSIAQTSVSGHPRLRLPGIANICFPGVRGDALLALLDLEGVAASAGSACAAGALQVSHVLSAVGRSREEARSSLRFSLSCDNTLGEVERLLRLLPAMVARLRQAGPPLSFDTPAAPV